MASKTDLFIGDATLYQGLPGKPGNEAHESLHGITILYNCHCLGLQVCSLIDSIFPLLSSPTAACLRSTGTDSPAAQPVALGPSAQGALFGGVYEAKGLSSGKDFAIKVSDGERSGLLESRREIIGVDGYRWRRRSGGEFSKIV